MGKQIRFLQTEADVNEFIGYCRGLGLKVLKDGAAVEEVGFTTQYFLSANDQNAVVEYDTPQLYSTKGQMDILSCGRLYLPTPADGETLKLFESLRKFIVKTYAHIGSYWFGRGAAEKVGEGEIIAATNFGTLQIADEKLQAVYVDTWLKNRRFVDGEWVDNTDIRYYRR